MSIIFTSFSRFIHLLHLHQSATPLSYSVSSSTAPNHLYFPLLFPLFIFLYPISHSSSNHFFLSICVPLLPLLQLVATSIFTLCLFLYPIKHSTTNLSFSSTSVPLLYLLFCQPCFSTPSNLYQLLLFPLTISVCLLLLTPCWLRLYFFDYFCSSNSSTILCQLFPFSSHCFYSSTPSTFQLAVSDALFHLLLQQSTAAISPLPISTSLATSMSSATPSSTVLLCPCLMLYSIYPPPSCLYFMCSSTPSTTVLSQLLLSPLPIYTPLLHLPPYQLPLHISYLFLYFIYLPPSHFYFMRSSTPSTTLQAASMPLPIPLLYYSISPPPSHLSSPPPFPVAR